MSHPRPFASLALTVVLISACKKDTPPADTQAPAAATKAPVTAPKTAAPAPNTKVAPQGAARPTKPNPTKGSPAANSASLDAADLATAQNVRTVQVAAYPTASPANWWVGELQRQNIPAYVLQSTVNGQTVYRVRIGATLTGEEARAVAQKIHARYKWPTWITMVEDKSVLPQGELQATRAYVGGGK